MISPLSRSVRRRLKLSAAGKIMELIDFEFAADRIGLLAAGLYIDLHNNYEFRSKNFDGQRLSMLWRRLNEPWTGPDQPKNIVLEIHGVAYCEVRGELSDSLDEIGFFDNESLGKVDYNGNTFPASGSEVLVFRFIGGGEIAVRGKAANIHLSIA